MVGESGNKFPKESYVNPFSRLEKYRRLHTFNIQDMKVKRKIKNRF